jgi:ABC-2 type transport system ATP-binding protein
VKAALAASLAYRPKLIVLDEPFSGLDVLVREELIESLAACTPESTILIASHDLGEIESFATHVGYLNEGRLEFAEEMDALHARFREIEVVLETPQDRLPQTLPPTWLNAEQQGVVARFTDTHYDPTRSREEVRRQFAGIRDVQAREMSFRSIFITMAKSRKTQCA